MGCSIGAPYETPLLQQAPSLTRKYQNRVELIDCDKHTSLSIYETNYGRKSFVIQVPEAYNIKLLMVLINLALGMTVTKILAYHVMSAMTLSIKTLSIMTFSISKLSIKGLFVTLRITILCHCAVYNYAKCCVLFVVMQSVAMLNALMLSVIMLTVVMLNVIMLSVIVLCRV
jgi:hypothetical protein